MTNNMSWKIVGTADACLSRILDKGEERGTIRENNGSCFTVTLTCGMRYETYSAENAIGYVRGVEHAVRVYGEETGRSKSKGSAR